MKKKTIIKNLGLLGLTSSILLGGAIVPVTKVFATEQSDGWVRPESCTHNDRSQARRVYSNNSIDTTHAQLRVLQTPEGVNRPIKALVYNTADYTPAKNTKTSYLSSVMYNLFAGGLMGEEHGVSVGIQLDSSDPFFESKTETVSALSQPSSNTQASVFGRSDANPAYSPVQWSLKAPVTELGIVSPLGNPSPQAVDKASTLSNVFKASNISNALGLPSSEETRVIKEKLKRANGRVIILGANQVSTENPNRSIEIDDMVSANYIYGKNPMVPVDAHYWGSFKNIFAEDIKEINVASSTADSAKVATYNLGNIQAKKPYGYESNKATLPLSDRANDIVEHLYGTTQQVEKVYISNSNDINSLWYGNRADFLSSLMYAANNPYQSAAFLFVPKTGNEAAVQRSKNIVANLGPGLLHISGGPKSGMSEETSAEFLRIASSKHSIWVDTSSPECRYVPSDIKVDKQLIAPPASDKKATKEWEWSNEGTNIFKDQTLYYHIKMYNKANGGYTTTANFTDIPKGLELLEYCEGSPTCTPNMPVPEDKTFRYSKRLNGGSHVDYIVKTRVSEENGEVSNTTNKPLDALVNIAKPVTPPNLRITKRLKEGTTLTPGTQATYVVDVQNTTDVPAVNVVVKDLPQVGEALSANLSTIQGQGTVSKEFTVTIPENFEEEMFNNKALWSADNAPDKIKEDFSSNTCNTTGDDINCSSVDTPLEQPKIKLTKTSDKPQGVQIGETINYTVRLENIGKVPLKNWRVFDKSSVKTTPYLDEKVNLGVGESKDFTYSEVVTAQNKVELANIFHNDVIVLNPKDPHYEDTPPNLDPNEFKKTGCTYNNCAETDTSVKKPALQISKVRKNPEAGVHEGVKAIWKVTVTNNGAGVAKNVIIKDPTAVVEGTNSHTKTIEALNVGETQEITFESIIGANHNKQANNTVTVTTDGVEEEPNATAESNDDSHIDITKVYEGNGTYLITVTNTGTTASQSLNVIDQTNLPGNIEVLETQKGSWNDKTWNIGVLEAKETVTSRVKFSTQEKPNVLNGFFNTVTVTNEGVPSTSTVKNKPLNVVKTFESGFFGSQLVYTITVNPSEGEGETLDTIITDTIDPTLANVEFSQATIGSIKGNKWVIPANITGTHTAKVIVNPLMTPENIKKFRTEGILNTFDNETPFQKIPGQTDGPQMDKSNIKVDLEQTTLAYKEGMNHVYKVSVKNSGDTPSVNVKVKFGDKEHIIEKLEPNQVVELNYEEPFEGKGTSPKRVEVTSLTEFETPSTCTPNNTVDEDEDRCDTLDTIVDPKVKLNMTGDYVFNGTNPKFSVEVKNTGNVPIVNGKVELFGQEYEIEKELPVGETVTLTDLEDVNHSTLGYDDKNYRTLDATSAFSSSLIEKGLNCKANETLEEDDDACDRINLTAEDKLKVNKTHNKFENGYDYWTITAKNEGKHPIYGVTLTDRMLENAIDIPSIQLVKLEKGTGLEKVTDENKLKITGNQVQLPALGVNGKIVLEVKTKRAERVGNGAYSVHNQVYGESFGKRLDPNANKEGIIDRDVCTSLDECDTATQSIPALVLLASTGLTTLVTLVTALLFCLGSGMITVTKLGKRTRK